jgi:hypothetical protein
MSGKDASLDTPKSENSFLHEVLQGISPIWISDVSPNVFRAQITELQAEVERLKTRLLRNQEIGS